MRKKHAHEDSGRPLPAQTWHCVCERARHGILALGKGKRRCDLRSPGAVPFAGSVADNLALGLSGEPVKGIDMLTEVRKSLELGDALEFVLSTDEGLDAQVGERGSLLSGGQKQRLCLARGFLRGTPILLLDEPTSSIDREAEARALSGLSSQRDLICLVVTHRFDVAEAADLVLVIDRGRLAEAGPHDSC